MICVGVPRSSRDAPQARRLLALAAIYDGGTRSEAARLGNVTLQIVRDWVVRFNAEGPGRADRPQGARPDAAADDAHRAALAQRDRARPDPGDPRRGALAADRSRPVAVGGVPRLGLDADAEPRAAGDGLSQALGAAEASCPGRRRHRGVQKNFPATLAEVRAAHPGKRIEIWFADEARIGQKNKLTRRWARRGTRPSAPQDQRTASTYIFGADLPGRGQGRRAGPALLQHRGDEPAPGRDQRHGRPRQARRAAARSGRLAPLRRRSPCRTTSPCCRCRRDRPS